MTTTRTIPTRGTASHVVGGGGTIAAAVKAADLQDCSLASVWILSGGQLVGYVPGAPELVNRPFESVVSGLVIPTLTSVTVFCGTVVTHADGLFAIDVPSDWISTGRGDSV